MELTPISIEETTRRFRFTTDEDRLNLSDVSLLEFNQFTSKVFRGKLIFGVNKGKEIFLCCLCSNKKYYARKVTASISESIRFDEMVTDEEFNRFEIFMISGVDCLSTGNTLVV